MALRMLTLENIKGICESPAGQAEIAKFAQEMNNQGVTKMFIDYTKVRKLVKRMVGDAILNEDTPMDMFSDEEFNAQFIAFSTGKMIEFLSRVDRIEEKSIFHGLPMLKELATYYLLNPFQPMKVFYWMSEFAMSYKVELQRLVDYYFGCICRDYDKHAMYNQLINDAIPMGINSEVQSLKWIYANENEYEQLDLSEIFAAIDFDRYYFEAFEKTPEEKACCNAEGENDPMKFVPKSEIKRLADEVFKPLVLDIAFLEAKSLSVADINAAIKKLFKEKPTLIYMLYSRAMFFVKESELRRFQEQLLKFFDENGIDYSLVPNQIDPRMFEDNPWSGNFS